MIVTKVCQSVADGIRELSADVVYEYDGSRERMYIRYPDAGLPNPCPADSFFVNLILISMALNERLEIDAPVSADVYAAVTKNTAILMREWYPRLYAPDVRVELSGAVPASAGDCCLLFSSGVDSWQALATRKGEVDALIHVRGFEMILGNQPIWDAAHATVRRVANNFNVQAVGVETNFFESTVPHVSNNADLNWRNFGEDVWGGHMLCAIGLSLRPKVNKLLIASSYAKNTTHVSSSELVEPSLSILSMQFEMAGSGVSRIQKTRYLVDHVPAFLGDLRVCIKQDFIPNRKINCGICKKCLRTQAELRSLGVSQFADPFETPLNLDMIRCFKLKATQGTHQLWQDVADQARRQGDPELAAAINSMLTQPAWRRRIRRFRRRLVRRFAKGV